MPTWKNAPQSPFGHEVERLPLTDTLVRVVAQVRFAPVLSVHDQAFIAPFQEATRQQYPLVRKEIQQQVAPGVGGALKLADSVLWKFIDAEDNWQVTLSDTFVSLDCKRYTQREDFMKRLSETLSAVGTHIRPVLMNRVGVRYTNRLSGDETLDQLHEFIRSELLGLAGSELDGAETLSEVTQAEFTVGNVDLRGRWGHLPAGATHDASVSAIGSESWILDLDAYRELTTPFDPTVCEQEAERFSDIVYGFFRWAVSDEFLQAHGAEQ